ncbi:ABC transporter ATP-binding protein [Tessaracoccus caeni]|uniref:ABC transporter ATP-binding protein n=1 Tax=Tessaracoccus caeni TaxID=3031239 RepID=UPI0023DA23E7|nr:ATP-binding cassette domain-containing protein [Tessaracoccus caeni]MDF1489575.1 ATP-binding cassette domain-containing protein [Tessaracoccus caeni]
MTSIPQESLKAAEPIIHVRDLTKVFERPVEPQGRFTTLRRLFSRATTRKVAVSGVSFDIAPGELVGYLGANGAGKSTTIKMLTGILVPTSGVVQVAGRVPSKDRKANAAHIGAVFGQRSQLWYDLPLRDSFELIRDLYGVRPDDYRERLDMFVELLGMDDFLDTPVRFLSLGQRMRGDLTAALLHAPEIVYLDEPTVGLDVVAKRRIREFVAEINATLGTTVILTTHDMDDVEALCRRIIMIDQGTVLFDGSLEDLKRRYVHERVLTVTPAEGIDPAAIVVDGASASVADGKAVLVHDPERIGTPDLIAQVTSRWQIVDLAVTEASLSDVVARIYAEASGR